MKQIKCFAVLIVACLLSVLGCINGNESNSSEPVVTTPSASSSANSAASSPATNNSFSVMDSSYSLDTVRTDTIRK